jgi:hypothetical protein
VNFLYLGQGINLTSLIPGQDPSLYVNAGPGKSFPFAPYPFPSIATIFEAKVDVRVGSFNWLGSDNSYWFLCPQKGNSTKYQVMKEVTVNDPRQVGCLSGIALVAIDYSGASPAAGVYL